MPRNVRNFWIELDVDARKKTVATGPQSATGGFTQRIHMRDEGCVWLAGTLRGKASSDGELVLSFEPTRGRTIGLVETQR